MPAKRPFSVTQSFNTTTSMGRLTLNVLLSFAQFEREVTGERIRDKIAASKKKGIWMGGVVPLGYRVEKRALHVVEEHAAFARDLFRRYLEIGSVVRLKTALDHENVRLPIRTDGSGKTTGGGLISRGHLYKLLSSPIYVGRLVHKGQVHQGVHEPIVDLETWEGVHRLLAEHAQYRAGARHDFDALLAGKLFDDRGNRMSPSHAIKGGRRYRYYVSQAIPTGSPARCGVPQSRRGDGDRTTGRRDGARGRDSIPMRAFDWRAERSARLRPSRRRRRLLMPPQAPRPRALSTLRPTSVPPSSASPSAAQRWRFSSPKGWWETLRALRARRTGNVTKPLQSVRLARAAASQMAR